VDAPIGNLRINCLDFESGIRDALDAILITEMTVV
jgi:hypothetical protein